MAQIYGICIPQAEGVDKVGGGPTTYVVSLPRFLQQVNYLVTRCLTVPHSVGRIQEHFMYCHFFFKVAVVQEGAEPLPFYGLCVMHMQAGRLIKHQQMVCCDKKTQMRLRRRDVEIVDKYSEADFSLPGEDKMEFIKGVEFFKYLRRLMDRLDEDWPAFHWNIRKARQLWGRLGKMLCREGAEPAVS